MTEHHGPDKFHEVARLVQDGMTDGTLADQWCECRDQRAALNKALAENPVQIR